DCLAFYQERLPVLPAMAKRIGSYPPKCTVDVSTIIYDNLTANVARGKLILRLDTLTLRYKLQILIDWSALLHSLRKLSIQRASGGKVPPRGGPGASKHPAEPVHSI